MTGRKRTVSNREILEAIASGDFPVYSTTDIAETFDFSQPGMLERLRELEDLGYLGTRKIGNANAWWLTDAGCEFLEAEE